MIIGKNTSLDNEMQCLLAFLSEYIVSVVYTYISTY